MRWFSVSLFLVVLHGGRLHAETLEGFTEPFRQIELSSNEPGVITVMEVEPGDVVHQGDVLASLDTEVLEATLKMAARKAQFRGNLESATAELTLRQDRLQQIETLRGRGNASIRELVRAQADVAIAEARLLTAREEVELNLLDVKRTEAQLARRRITSPINGVVSVVHREIGEATLISDPRMITLVQLDKLRVRFSAPPAQTRRFSPGQTVELTLPEANVRIAGVVERISPVIDPKSGTLEMHVTMDNADGTLRSGDRCLLTFGRTNDSDQLARKTEN